ncbi:glycosyltransferase [Desulfosarcina sp. OttesenSCG-928-A07]|nr:glycosyltransferase [Desulfosarcina sp. OttesenSCG-928-G17]MDL2328266.1 glycosyltransferase [Desulfosarcina sp. OttesenSCG-928-A07]
MRKPSPLVSVIIPTYNRLPFLKKAVASVLSQSFRSMELIIVDDGSTDGTDSWLNTGIAGEVTVIRQSNKGVSAARNTGILASASEFVAFLDSDDTWLPEKLAQQVDFFQMQPEALICQTGETWVRNGVRVNPGKRHRKESGMIFERSLGLCLVSPSAVMIRRSLLDEVGLFDESLPACEDYDLWLRIAWNYPIYLLDVPLVVKYGGHSDQLSRMPELDKFRIRSISKLLDRNCLSAGQRGAAIAMLETKCAIYATGCRRRGRAAEADEYMMLAARYR